MVKILAALLVTILIDDPVALFLDRAESQVESYKGHRVMEGTAAWFSGKLEVMTAFSKENGFTYEIKNQSGNEKALEKLKILLEMEKKGTNSKSSTFTSENYTFRPHKREKNGITSLLLSPRKDSVEYEEVTLFVRAEDGELLQMEGKPAKNHSGLKSEKIVRHYERRGGFRVAVKTVLSGRWGKPFPLVPVTSTYMDTYYEINGQKVK